VLGAKDGAYDCEGAAVQDIAAVGDSPRGAEEGECLLVRALGDGVHLLGVLNRRPLGHKPHACSRALEGAPGCNRKGELLPSRNFIVLCLLKVPCGLKLWQVSLTGTHALISKQELPNRDQPGI
jgi:hypothetical protein